MKTRNRTNYNLLLGLMAALTTASIIAIAVAATTAKASSALALGAGAVAAGSVALPVLAGILAIGTGLCLLCLLLTCGRNQHRHGPQHEAVGNVYAPPTVFGFWGTGDFHGHSHTHTHPLAHPMAGPFG